MPLNFGDPDHDPDLGFFAWLFVGWLIGRITQKVVNRFYETFNKGVSYPNLDAIELRW